MEINDKSTSYPIGPAFTDGTFEATERLEKKQTQDGEKTEGSEPVDQHAVVSISQASREAQRIKEILESEEVIREDKIIDLKRKIESGTYTVDYENVASKLVDDWVKEV